MIMYHHGKKSIRLPFRIYVNIEYLLEKIVGCKNNSKKYEWK